MNRMLGAGVGGMFSLRHLVACYYNRINFVLFLFLFVI